MDPKRRLFENTIKKIDQVVERASRLHSEKSDFGTGTPLFRSEIHAIQAVGNAGNILVTELADQLKVSKSAVSQVLLKLVKKGLVVKNRNRNDGREISLSLTSKGWIAYHNHELIHTIMFQFVEDHFGESFSKKIEELLKVMDELDGLMKKFEKKMKQEKKKVSALKKEKK